LATARGAPVSGLVFCGFAMRTLAHADSLQHNFNLDTLRTCYRCNYYINVLNKREEQ
jgi:hypothetical protein